MTHQPPTTSHLSLRLPNRSSISRDDTFSSFKCLGDNESEVLAQRRENEHVAPGPDLLLLLAKGVADNAERERGVGVQW